ncbi:MAG: response regulator transcription factor [Nitrospirae bacterium]|nr:response regulator transcription factor [Nitrospirota bacterium]MBI3595473.1 response regulator transcription factor [Nitrospirota bacterium]
MNPILIVDDDIKISSLIANSLQNDGFATIRASDGEEAIQSAEKNDPRLIILDLMLPKIDGIEVCRQIRKNSEIPILMLTQKADEFDKILGLSIGADDYLTKPFSPRELIARVRAILRRSIPKAQGSIRKLKCLDLEIDFDKCNVTLLGKDVSLTVYEYKILQALASSPGHVLTREQLIQKIYAYEDVSVVDRVIDVHVANLRSKIEDDNTSPKYILTVRGMGYKFSEAFSN